MGDPLSFDLHEGSLPRSGGAATLTPAEAFSYLRQGAVLVDLREAYETNFRVFDVERVIYVPWSRFAAGLGELPRGEAIVVADAVGIYAREAVRALAAAGYENLAAMAGGMVDWDAAGLPVRKDAEYELGGQCACKMKTRHGGNPLLDKHGDADSKPVGDGGIPMTRVLFLCVHNSARSQMAEAFLRKHGGGRFEVDSAGLEPGKLNTYVVRAMAETGIDISGNGTKSVFDLRAAGKTYEVVVTVCSPEAAERCPIFPGMAEKHHWPFDDPSTFTGSDEDIMRRVRVVRDRIEAAVQEFVAGH